MNAVATAPATLVRVANTLPGQKVTATTGSPKTKNLQHREGVITGYAPRTLSTGRHYVLEAIVTLTDGTEVRTHRLSA